MKFLLSLLVLLSIASPAFSETRRLDSFNAGVEVPQGDGWLFGDGPKLLSGEFEVFWINKKTGRAFGVAVIPGFPVSDVTNKVVVTRINEVMKSIAGFAATRQRDGKTDQDLTYVELIGAEKNEADLASVCVMRGMLQDGKLILIMDVRPGADADADTADFLTSINSFKFERHSSAGTFITPTGDPRLVVWHWRAWRLTGIAVVLLLGGFLMMLMFAKPRRRRARSSGESGT